MGKVVSAITNPISKVLGTSGGGGGILGGLASLDKAVGNIIPGGWGTLASVAASAAGVPIGAQVGLGALTGSGVMRPGRGFNLQGAIMGGITAYGLGKLGEGVRGAANAAGGPSVPIPGEFTPSSTGLMTLPGEAAGYVGSPTSGLASVYSPSVGSQLMSGDISGAASTLGGKISNAASAAIDPNTYRTALDNVSQTGTGIKNLMGLGDITAKEAAQGFAGTGAKLTNTAVPIGMGLTGTMAIDEMRNQQQQADAANAAAQQEYNNQMAIIAANQRRGEEAMRRNPYMFKEGGEVPGYFGGGIMAALREKIEQARAAGATPQPQAPNPAGFFARVAEQLRAAQADTPQGRARAALEANPYQFNQGGMPPRFLSGGGDGMSDSIPAKINGRQEARLADGEFVIPADVVSHLGNGSSKAGAKQLYSMMDRVRQKRTGTKQQGKEINPRKLMPA